MTKADELFKKYQADGWIGPTSFKAALREYGAPSPIKTAMELLESRVSHLQDVSGRLMISLQPVTRNTDDCYPAELGKVVEGNSTLNIDINALATRVGGIAVSLQLQIDRLEL